MFELTINSRRISIDLPGDATVLDLLRNRLHLFAAKPGCNTGDCGACAVLLGERPAPGAEPLYHMINSCLLTIARAEGCHIITAEGLHDGTPSPVHRALIDGNAIQCGYCTPGIAIAMTGALLKGDNILQAVSGNLCRCTGYAGIRRACDILSEGQHHIKPGLQQAVVHEWLPYEVVQAGLHLPPPRSATAMTATEPATGPWKLLAGGTDWVPQHRHHGPPDQRTLLLQQLPSLRNCRQTATTLEIGAAITIAELQQHQAIRRLWHTLPGYLERFASPAVRHIATVGGNIANASPVADLAVIMLAMDAALLLEKAGQQRLLPLADFFPGYHQTALQPGEIIVALHIPITPKPLLRFEKVCRRRLDDIASVNMALVAELAEDGTITHLQISAGGVAPTPRLLGKISAFLQGKAPTAEELRAALSLINDDIAPIDDLRGSAGYKRQLLKNLVASALCPLLKLPVSECLP